MPSPFPGMDPHLERPSLWPDVHNELISTCRELLNQRLRPKYVARTEERVFVAAEEDPERAIYIPDLRVARRPGRHKPRGSAPRGAIAVTEPVELTTLTPDEFREPRIEIRATDNDRPVVAVIEILSPTNKIVGSAGRASFLGTKEEILASPAHWVEIDLLREGAHPSFRSFLGPHEYAVHVSPADRRPKGRVWPIRLRDRLPVIGVPLRKPDADVPLDLQEALNLAYDRAAYDMTVDYRDDPIPPLPADLARWAAKLLKQKGLR